MNWSKNSRLFKVHFLTLELKKQLLAYTFFDTAGEISFLFKVVTLLALELEIYYELTSSGKVDTVIAIVS